MLDAELTSLLQSVSAPLPLACTQLTGGANNRVYQLHYQDKEPLVLKRYFQHPHDPRQRLQAEYSFLTYAWNLGLRCIPQPLAQNPHTNAALYSFLPGKPFRDSLCYSSIEQAIDFFLSLNHSKEKGLALPNASESYFSMQGHLTAVESRIQQLLPQKSIQPFLREYLLPSWEKVKSKIRPTDSLLEDRCISPSDFGFHNALLQENRQVAFIDFEYAGWDDPAKTVCDFFCQPRIPIPSHFFSDFSTKLLTCCKNPEQASERVRTLFPVYQIKWCCILLNCFLPVGQTRRAFAFSEEQKEEQLKKTKSLIDQLEAPPWLT